MDPGTELAHGRGSRNSCYMDEETFESWQFKCWVGSRLERQFETSVKGSSVLGYTSG